MFAQRIRQATKKGGKVMSVHALRDDWLMPISASIAAVPSAWLSVLGDIAAEVASAKSVEPPLARGEGATSSDEAKAMAKSLASGERKAVLLGNSVAHHPDAAAIEALAGWIAAQTGATLGWLGEGGNAVGAQLVEARPGAGGQGAAAMLGSGSPLKACLLLNVEPGLEAADGPAALQTLRQAELVVSLTSFKPSPEDDSADVLLPIAPFTETSGTFVNAEGRVQSFHGVVKPLADARPAWKVLRVLGNLLGLSGFQFETSDEVRAEALGDVTTIPARLATSTAPVSPLPTAAAAPGLERIADVPIYMTDAIVRRSPALQMTADARVPQVVVPTELAAERGIVNDMPVRVTQGSASIVLPARVDASLASNVVRITAGHPLTYALGPMFGTVTISVEPVTSGSSIASASETAA